MMKIFNIEETKIILGENATENWGILDDANPTITSFIFLLFHLDMLF